MTKRRYPTLKKLRGGSGIPRESEPPRRDRTWRSPGGSISNHQRNRAKSKPKHEIFAAAEAPFSSQRSQVLRGIDRARALADLEVNLRRRDTAGLPRLAITCLRFTLSPRCTRISELCA